MPRPYPPATKNMPFGDHATVRTPRESGKTCCTAPSFVAKRRTSPPSFLSHPPHAASTVMPSGENRGNQIRLTAFGSPAGEPKAVKRIWFPRFSPDGMTVLAACGGWDKKEGGEVRLFATKDGAVQHVFPLSRGVRTVAWSPKGMFFVAGGYGLGIHGFDVKDRKELFHLAGDRQVENLRITSDDKI